MTAHLCITLAPEGQCYRCDLNRDELTDQQAEEAAERASCIRCVSGLAPCPEHPDAPEEGP